MRRYIVLFFQKTGWWRDAKVRLPGVNNTVHTSTLYMAAALLLLAVSTAIPTYHAWREYRGGQWGISEAALEDQLPASEGRDKKLSVSATGGRKDKHLPSESIKTVEATVGDKPAKPDKPVSSRIEQEKMVKPLMGKILTTYGWQEDPIYKDWRFFPGIVIQGEKGSEVYAVKSGKVLDIPRDGRESTVKIGHADGMVTIYGHLSDSGLRIGQSVIQGQLIGCLGMDGETSLHFEIWQDNRSIDPRGLFKE